MEQKGKKLVYSVQEHHASHLHYDLRLEKDGVLKSWAVPKGIPYGAERRLAVEVEDHPLSYAFFEGEIPEGEYGAGKVKLWDRGSYEQVLWSENEIKMLISGQRIKGTYLMIRMSGKNWLLSRAKA